MFDVFVRSVLLYGCSVWGTTFVRDTGELVMGDRKEVGLFYRKCLRGLLGVGFKLRNEVVCALTGRLPVHVPIARAMHRHEQSLVEHPRRAAELFKWEADVESGERADG